jgi:DNA-binding response OmpR family regulator
VDKLQVVPAVERARETAETRRRILIVDDGQRTREMFFLLLRKQGHEVETAADGESGIVMVVRFHPDAVLLDVGMPGLNGFDTCQRIRAQKGNSPALIAVTGWAQYEIQERAEKAGFDAILVKPVGVRQILETVERLLESKERCKPEVTPN